MNLFRISIILIGLALTVSCGSRPEVIQGTVVAMDSSTHTLTIRNELPPNEEKILDISKADYGSVPHVGELLRIAYREKQGQLQALRIMTLGKSELETKGGH